MILKMTEKFKLSMVSQPPVVVKIKRTPVTSLVWDPGESEQVSNILKIMNMFEKDVLGTTETEGVKKSMRGDKMRVMNNQYVIA